MTMVSNTALSLLSKEVGLTSAPFLWDSDAQGTCVNQKHLIQALSPLLGKAGVKPLAWMEVGHQIIFAKSPVKTPADLAGKKLRTAPTLSDTLYARAAGTSAVPLSPADTVPALQTGNVDAATWPAAFGISVGTHKVAPNLTVTNHIRQVGALVISNRARDKLTDEEKGWLSAVAPMGESLTAAVFGAENALIGQIEKAGVSIYRPNQAEMAEWKKGSASIFDEMVKQIGGDAPAIAKAIADAKASCGS
jgi:TRAP-type C4-dicarboxylate transport system substrate-binding protein